MKAKPVKFRYSPFSDGVVPDVEEWPVHVAVTDELIERADPEYLFLDVVTGELKFIANNGWAIYQLAHREPYHIGHYDFVNGEIYGGG